MEIRVSEEVVLRHQLAFERLAVLERELQKKLEEGKAGKPVENGGQTSNAHSLNGFFLQCTRLLQDTEEMRRLWAEHGYMHLSMEQLDDWNSRLYGELQGDQYRTSWANPSYAAGRLGEKDGMAASILYAELRGAIVSAAGGYIEELTVTAELFLEVYSALTEEDEQQLKGEVRGQKPEDGVMAKKIKQILYWYAIDYMDLFAGRRIREQIGLTPSYGMEVLEQAGLTFSDAVHKGNGSAEGAVTAEKPDLCYLYGYGFYISDDEKELAAFLLRLPKDTVEQMAAVFVKGYVDGFAHAGIDLGEKTLVELRYGIGFERVICTVVRQLADLGLRCMASPVPDRIVTGRGGRAGYGGTSPNRQYDYDHRDDLYFILDKRYVQRRLEMAESVYKSGINEAKGYAGPAVWESFGEPPFSPARTMELGDQKLRSLKVEMDARMSELIDRFIDPKKRSFVIIAYPVPAIGSDFENIFRETIRLNALDSDTYSRIQQCMIDVLDTGEYVRVKGRGDNETDMTIRLWTLSDSEKETIFENCVADVNIPVGEVFTSPVLEGTNGVLHVSGVYLNGLYFRDLKLTFSDGVIADYSCKNFDTKEQNRKYIEDHLLFGHPYLPLGEFAIGTNTRAYVMAKKYDIADRLPILIAEKTGPHFAVGDTCYSHSEEVRVFNPDKKEIVARENAFSVQRYKEGAQAYFQCHTDITLPYDELEEISVVTKDGKERILIKDGKFVLPGCEELNIPLEEYASLN